MPMEQMELAIPALFFYSFEMFNDFDFDIFKAVHNLHFDIFFDAQIRR